MAEFHSNSTPAYLEAELRTFEKCKKLEDFIPDAEVVMSNLKFRKTKEIKWDGTQHWLLKGGDSFYLFSLWDNLRFEFPPSTLVLRKIKDNGPGSHDMKLEHILDRLGKDPRGLDYEEVLMSASFGRPSLQRVLRMFGRVTS